MDSEISLKCGICFECDYAHENKFIPHSKMTDNQKIFFDYWKSLNTNKEPKKERAMIPQKTNNNWVLLCEVCFENKGKQNERLFF